MTTTDLARVSALLDDAKNELEGFTTASIFDQQTRAWKKIDEAQRVLVGDKPTRAEDN